MVLQSGVVVVVGQVLVGLVVVILSKYKCNKHNVDSIEWPPPLLPFSPVKSLLLLGATLGFNSSLFVYVGVIKRFWNVVLPVQSHGC